MLMLAVRGNTSKGGYENFSSQIRAIIAAANRNSDANPKNFAYPNNSYSPITHPNSRNNRARITAVPKSLNRKIFIFILNCFELIRLKMINYVSHDSQHLYLRHSCTFFYWLSM
jgi:hypothetical protein